MGPAQVACSLWDDGEAVGDEANAVEIAYSLALLPDDVMEPRRGDDRVGFFGSTYEQLGPLPKDILGGDAGLPDLSFADADQRVNYIHKWRLEKNESACDEGGCAPLKQITYHLDPTIPAPLRPTVKAGVLAWQPAFDALGFTQAVKVVQPGDADWPRDYDPGDVRFSSVTWLPYPELGLAIGPSVVDPRSGEILYSRPAR